MKINFTKNQFRTLIKAVFLGEWLFESNKIDKDKEMHDLQQYIYSHAKDFGLEDMIEYDKEYKEYFPTPGFEQEMDPKIEEYNDDTFWSLLTYAVSRADMIRTYGQKALDDMPTEQLARIQQESLEKTSKEFEENGLDNLRVIF